MDIELSKITSEAFAIIKQLKIALEETEEFALVFGSLLTENFTEKSDIDLAIYSTTPLTDYQSKVNFKISLLDYVSHDIDLIILNTSDIIITMQALANGKLIVVKNISFFNLFKAQKLSEYIDFKISRRIIESSMLNGRLYA